MLGVFLINDAIFKMIKILLYFKNIINEPAVCKSSVNAMMNVFVMLREQNKDESATGGGALSHSEALTINTTIILYITYKRRFTFKRLL